MVQASPSPSPVHDDPVEAPGPARDPFGWLAVLLLVAAMGQASVFSMRFDCFDFYQFWVVGQAVREAETGNVWSAPERERLGVLWLQRARSESGPGSARPSQRRTLASGRRSDLETYSTPWLYTLFGVAATGDYDRDLAWFQNVSLVAFTLALLAMARIAGLSWSAAALLAAFVLTFFAPTLSDMRVGNVNRMQLAALGLYLWVATRPRLPQRDLLAGALLGAAALFKPNLAFPALALGLGWMVLGRWHKLTRQVGGALLGALAAFGLASAWFGRADAWSDWLAVLGELMGEYDHALSKGNFALVRLLEDAGLGAGGALMAGLLGAGLLAALFARRRALAGGETSEPQRFLEDLALVGLGGALSVLTARLAWVHYFLLVIPLAVVLLRRGARPWVRIGGGLGLLLLAHEPLKDLLHYPDSGTLAAGLVCAGVALLYCVALLDLARPQPQPAGD